MKWNEAGAGAGVKERITPNSKWNGHTPLWRFSFYFVRWILIIWICLLLCFTHPPTPLPALHFCRLFSVVYCCFCYCCELWYKRKTICQSNLWFYHFWYNETLIYIHISAQRLLCCNARILMVCLHFFYHIYITQSCSNERFIIHAFQQPELQLTARKSRIKSINNILFDKSI